MEPNREIVHQLDLEFEGLIKSLQDLVRSVPQELLYRNSPAGSVGESILRGAAAVEQICGGLTANLWDDPFEWTLPETLSSVERIVDYLAEVDLARQRMFSSIADNDSLSKYISTPSSEPRPLVSLLLETLVRTGEYRGQARANLKILSGESV